MDKENVFDDESDSEDEEKVMLNLPDSDVDEIEDQLNGIGLNDDDAYLPHEMNKVMLNKSKDYESEEYSFVRDTMESTGIARKSLNEFTPSQKRIASVPYSNIPQKLLKVQHFSSKTDYNENRQGHVQKRCVLCRSKQVRKQTIYFCRTCPDTPALCYPDCFDAFHSKI
ncbi:unnamed protein product [Rotaria sp. Silwood1]|nr:unnamed protein product [Rotaria sp. Silwood1]CAF3508454.1 unnamed protein product [Rotaria sp. Silwood1]CAF3601676.1 unnamed protein product [Rotaria sp. Silwood1]CAF4755124.1 unnamed protein product [Rotaria sp. Silwood1]CAF4818358.1 unnamed protein product [Rotaria sp. Silwood1]